MANQADAHKICDMLISSIRDSNLNFFVQETPFSAFINIRKTFCKGGKDYKKLVHEDKQHENLEQENKLLKDKLEEKSVQLEASKEDICVLQSRLEKAEKELFEHSQNKKISEIKQGDEILKLKSVISSLKSESIEADRATKSHEKIVQNLEKKNKNLVEQVATMKAAKNDFKSDKLNLMNELKALKMKTLAQKKMKSAMTQTDPLTSLPPCTCLDNNNTPAPATPLQPTSSQTYTDSSTSSIAFQSVQCLICEESFKTADDLAKHTAAEHDVSINVKKFTDFKEDDNFLRFLKSMIIDQQYLEERVKYYPKNSDHIYERIKIRIMAQIKFSSFSRTFERNMEENDYRNSSYKENSKEV